MPGWNRREERSYSPTPAVFQLVDTGVILPKFVGSGLSEAGPEVFSADGRSIPTRMIFLISIVNSMPAPLGSAVNKAISISGKVAHGVITVNGVLARQRDSIFWYASLACLLVSWSDTKPYRDNPVEFATAWSLMFEPSSSGSVPTEVRSFTDISKNPLIDPSISDILVFWAGISATLGIGNLLTL